LKGGLAIVIISILISWGYFRNRQKEQSKTSEQHELMHIAKMTGSGHVQTAVISPDGKYIAYAVSEGTGKQGIVLRHIATARELPIVPSARTSIIGLTFSKDSNYLYYVSAPETKSVGILYRITVLGGDAQEIVRDVDSTVTLSPDDRQIAYLRLQPQKGTSYLVVANADGSGEHIIFTAKWGEMGMGDSSIANGGPAWSPNGRILAVVVAPLGGRFPVQLMTIGTDGSSPKLICERWSSIDYVAWQEDGGKLLLEGTRGSLGTSQLWTVSYPGCSVRRITNDTDSYVAVSATADSHSLVTLQRTMLASIWVVEAKTGRAKEISVNSSTQDGRRGIAWTRSGSILYSHKVSDNWNLALIDPVTLRVSQVAADSFDYSFPFSAPDGHSFCFTSNRDGASPAAIFRMRFDGGGITRITDRFGKYPIISEDGKWVFYSGRKGNVFGLLRVPYDGGEPQFVTKEYGGLAGDSVDGKLVGALQENDKDSTWRVVMIPVDGGAPAMVSAWIPDAQPSIPGIDNPRPRLTPDRKRILYIGYNDGVENLWAHDFAGPRANQLTHFTDLQHIFYFAMSPDGRIAMSRGTVMSDVVLINRPTL
jgi:Tol biopolymer transport system component